MGKQIYTATVRKNPNTGRFDVMVAAIGGCQVHKHRSYANYARAEKVAKQIEAQR